MRSAHDQPVKVLYVAGCGRSGSTILANILGQAPGFVSVGELYMMWESALIRPNVCGCGRLVTECPFWNEVFQQSFGGMSLVDPQAVDRILRHRFRTRHYILHRHSAWLQAASAETTHLFRELDRLYHGIAQVSGAQVIVDESKRPVYGLLLDEMPNIELYVVHIVRDPRAVAYSWSRRMIDAVTGLPVKRMGLIRSSIKWTGINPVTEDAFRRLVGENRYVMLRYEDLVSDPKATYQSILKLVRWDLSYDPFTSKRVVSLGLSHTVAGNRSRFARGSVEITADSEWETGMSSARKLLVSAITWPLLVRYRYPLLKL